MSNCQHDRAVDHPEEIEPEAGLLAIVASGRRQPARPWPACRSEVGGSTTPDVAFESVANLRPGLAGIEAGSCPGRALLDLGSPGRFDIGVRAPIEARDQLRDKLRTAWGVELQRLLEELRRPPGHGGEIAAEDASEQGVERRLPLSREDRRSLPLLAGAPRASIRTRADWRGHRILSVPSGTRWLTQHGGSVNNPPISSRPNDHERLYCVPLTAFGESPAGASWPLPRSPLSPPR